MIFLREKINRGKFEQYLRFYYNIDEICCGSNNFFYG